MTVIEAIEARIEELTKKRESNKQAMQPLYKENSMLTDEIQELQAQVLKLQAEAISTEEDMIKFYIKDDGMSHGMDHYHARKRFFESIGLDVSGYYPKTEQCGFQVSIDSSGSNIDSTVAGINKVLPYMIPFDGSEYDRGEIIHFSIFEYTCSEYGSYSLIYDKDKEEWAISIIAWHRRREVKAFKLLREALEYLAEHHHSDYPEDEEEDDDEFDGYHMP
ncbi:hypothetical protein XbC2_83 [Xanthomonas phage XbC2]|nr:hypothetical protein XbC2_83 [Xanthomonas phage XbC2]